MTTSPAGRRSARALLVGAAAALATAVASAPASAAVTLDWTTANVYAGNCGTTRADCTWLGYTTGNAANRTPFGANGKVTPSDGATGTTVTTGSPRGADQLATWSFQAASGTIDESNLTGEMQFDGKLSFVSPAPPAGHGFTITVEDPRIVLNGATGGIYASGSSSTGAYDASLPIFTLDTADVSSKLRADGTRVIDGFVPAIANAGRVFPARSYPDGAGPDRRPNTFGSFAIAVSPNTGPKGDKGDKGDTGAAGRNGTNGTNGADGKNGTITTIRVQTTTLASAPFKGKAGRKIRVTARKSSRTLATGTVKGRTLTITLARGVKKKQLKGRYVLRLTGGKRGSAVVRL